MMPFFSTIQSRIYTAVAAVFIVGGVVVFALTRTMLTRDILELEKGFAAEVRDLVRLSAENTFSQYLDRKNDAVAERKRRAQQACKGALVGISLLRSLEADGSLTGAQARRKALDWVKTRTFGPDKDAVFILDESLTGLAAPNPQLEGRKWIGLPNLKGQDAFELVAKTVRETGRTSSVFWWADRPGGSRSKRLGVFYAFPDWHWIVGSMVDIEELDRLDEGLREKARQDLVANLSAIRYGEVGRLFVVDGMKRLVPGPRGEPGGPDHALPFPEKILESGRNSEPVEYEWPDPATGVPGRMAAFVERFAPLDVTMVLTASLSELAKPGIKLAYVQAAIAFGGLVFGLCLLFPIIQGVSRPIAILAEKARNLPEGNFSDPEALARELDELAAGASTEVADLSRGFRFMLRELGGHLRTVRESQSLLGDMNRTLERRVAERTHDLELAKDAAQEASKAKTLFLANMSHEIRTPITTILGLAELWLFAPSPGKEAGYARRIIESTHMLLAIVNDILDLSRVEAGKLALEDVPFAPRETIESALAGFHDACREKGLDFSVRWGTQDLPDRLSGDPVRLAQVLGNLVGNAVKFAQRGSVTVDIGMGAPRGDGRVEIRASVADTGPGIPPEQREKIFESFHQVDSSYAKSHQGSGLGLAICRELTALMGGRVWMEPNPGGGSVFRFTARFGRCPAPARTAA